MPRQVRDRLALTYGVWSVVFAAALAGFAWKFGWLPVDVSPPETDSASGATARSALPAESLSESSTTSNGSVEPADPFAEEPPTGAAPRKSSTAELDATGQSEPPVELGANGDVDPDADAGGPLRPSSRAEMPRRADSRTDEPREQASSDRRKLGFDAEVFPPRSHPKRTDTGLAPPPGIGRRRPATIDDLARATDEPSEGILIRPDPKAKRGAASARTAPPRTSEGDSSDRNDFGDEPRAERTATPRRGARSPIVQVGGEFVDDEAGADTAKSRGASRTGTNATRSNGSHANDAIDPDGTGAATDPRLAELEKLIAAGDRLAVHKEMSKLYWKEADLRPELQERIDANARIIYFTPQPHYMEPYVVNGGDQLQKIAKQYQVPWEYLVRLNQIDPKRIRPGQRLKVIKGPFAALVDLSDFELIVHAHGYYVKRYEIGIGKDDSTPVGKFNVKTKLKNPTYYGPNGVVIDADDTSNPLGERWIDLGESYGIHGTIAPDSIGKAASRGCLRLKAADIEELYDLLSEGSEVVIRK